MRLAWGKVGERRYEAGIDRGVLYIDGMGYAWSGLTSVKEGHSGGESRAYYVDGVRYANRLTLEEFEATIEAYTYPEEFGACDGTKSLGNGLFVTQQRRKQFGFSYRTLIGNDVEGLEHGYKLHIVYNALAQPFDRSHDTISDSFTPSVFSWKVATKPPVLDFTPTSHFIIDSRSTPDGLMTQIEDLLYGTAQQMPRLPPAGELAYLFANYTNPVLDAGDSDDPVYFSFDAGRSNTVNTALIDGGTS